jgi:response regulator RpfG family c-di-GMP phosphodiesterase
MNPILIVDDDELMLATYSLVCGTKYPVHTALSADEGLAKLEANGPYAVVVSDMRMPKMNGASFLGKVRERWPDTVRIMLTGDRGWDTRSAAVNEGSVFRILFKPCSADLVLQTVSDGVRTYELVAEERELREKTLNGIVDFLTEILSLSDLSQRVRSQKLRERVGQIARQLNLADAWELELAAMLCEIGSMTVPPYILHKAKRGGGLTAEEQQLMQRIPEIGGRLLSRIPRFGGVAQVIRFQAKHFDGRGFPQEAIEGDQIPLGARLLKILHDLISLEDTGASTSAAMKELAGRRGWYDPVLLEAVNSGALPPEQPSPGVAKALRELRTGQKLAANVLTKEGVVLASAGYTVTETLLERLQNFAVFSGVQEPLYIEKISPPSSEPTAN